MRVLVPALCALALGIAAAPAEARSGSCLVPGVQMKCTIWTGKVTYIGDGDTIYVKVDGDTTHSIRFTGVNAMEQTVYSSNPARRRGFCHALAATSRIEGLIRRAGGRVRLAAIDASSASRKRWRRAVAVKIGGRWRDLGRILVSEGLALWLPNGNEWVWNAEYSELAERAAAAHRGIWNPTACGRGPQDSIPLRLDVNGDADGSDDENVNGEWIRIHNLDPVKTLRLGGWYVRDTAPPRYVLPDWVTVPPGEELTVHVGRGTNTFTELFWGLKKGIFDTVGNGQRGLGDGAFLLDPQGDMRAWMTYPCRLNCTDPYQGKLKVTADGQGVEHVDVRNVGTAPVDLDGYKLSSPPHVYAFGRATTLAPGETLRVQVTGDPEEDSRLFKYWGKPGTILDDHGDIVRLTNLRGVVIDCFAYGAATC